MLLMDLNRMLARCRREQWHPEDIDWDRPARDLSSEDESRIVQYFTDMAGIERLAGALFREQAKKATDPRLREIFDSFVEDELRHALVAQHLADHYNRRQLRRYRPNPHMLKFTPHFVRAVRLLPPDIANAYITTGEVMLDIALLRSLNDYVDDDTSRQAMDLINRDESRHLAIDYHMVGYYASEAYKERLAREPKRGLGRRLSSAMALTRMLYHGRPFFRAVFFEPMDMVDPSGRRLRQAFKRIQLLATKDGVKDRPFVKFMLTLQDLFNHPVYGMLFGRVLVRIIGTDPRVVSRLYDDEDKERVFTMSFDEMAQEALGAKYAAR